MWVPTAALIIPPLGFQGSGRGQGQGLRCHWYPFNNLAWRLQHPWLSLVKVLLKPRFLSAAPNVSTLPIVPWEGSGPIHNPKEQTGMDFPSQLTACSAPQQQHLLPKFLAWRYAETCRTLARNPCRQTWAFWYKYVRFLHSPYFPHPN